MKLFLELQKYWSFFNAPTSKYAKKQNANRKHDMTNYMLRTIRKCIELSKTMGQRNIP